MANRYWVGGTGSWSDTAHWSTTSGGAGGASVPTSADSVILNSASSASGYTVTVDVAASCLDFSLGAPASGTVILAGATGIILSVFGNWTVTSASNVSLTFAGTVTFAATSTGKTITSNGTVWPSGARLSFNGAGGGWTLADALSTGNTINFLQGAFSSGGFSITCGNFTTSASNGQTVTLGSSTLTVTGSGFTLLPGIVSAGSATIVCTGNVNFQGAGGSFGTVTMNGTSNSTLLDSNTFVNLNRNGGSTNNSMLVLGANQTVTGTFTPTSNTISQRLLIRSDTPGTQRTITAAAVSLTNVDFQDILGAGAATWSGTSIGDCLGNSGITFTVAVTRYATNATGNTTNWNNTNMWSASSGGASGASIPLSQDDVILNASSPTSITANNVRCGKNLDCTGYTGTLTETGAAAAGGFVWFGNLKFASGMTLSGTTGVTLQGRGSQTLTSAGKTMPGALGISAPGGSYTLQDDLTISGANGLTLTAGSLVDNGKAIGVGGAVTILGAVTKTGTWTLGGTGSILSLDGAASFNDTAGSIIANDSSSTAKTLSLGSGLTLNKLSLQGTGSGSFNLNGSASLGTLEVLNPPHTLVFQAGQTLQIGTASISGTAGNLNTLASSSGGTKYNLVKTGGGISNSDYLSIGDSAASPSLTWFAGAHSTNVGGNTGWTFQPGSAASLTGASAAGAVGSMGKNPQKGLPGASATASLGTLGMTASSNRSVTGVQGTGAVGSIAAAAATLMGASAVGGAGQIVLTAGDSLVGVFATGSVGTLSKTLQKGVAGASAFGTAGLLGKDIGARMMGAAAVGSAGALPGWVLARLSGVSAAGAAGAMRGGPAQRLTGASAVGQAASLVGGAAPGLSGVVAVCQAGSLQTEPFARLPGVGAAGAAGSLENGLGAVLRGIAGFGLVGSLARTGQEMLSGVAADGRAGAVVSAALAPLNGAAGIGAAASLATGPGARLLSVSASGFVGGLREETNVAPLGVTGTGAAGSLTGGPAGRLASAFATGVAAPLTLTASGQEAFLGVSAAGVGAPLGASGAALDGASATCAAGNVTVFFLSNGFEFISKSPTETFIRSAS